MKYKINVEKLTQSLVDWVRVWFNHNGPNCNAVLGISGGKDSTIAAAILVEALGKDRVIGVMLPNGKQHDQNVAKEVCDYLGIRQYEMNIRDIYDSFIDTYCGWIGEPLPSEQSLINLAPRIRMTALRFVAQTMNGRFINTSNLSEDWVGYATIDGDSAGDMSVFSMLTVREVKAIGHYLKLPDHFVEKVPEDGLVGKSDEENLGVTYADIDAYIRNSSEVSPETIEKIEKKFRANEFKLRATSGMPKFYPNLEDLYEDVTKGEIEKIPSLSMDFRWK